MQHGIADQKKVSELFADGAVLTERELLLMTALAEERRQREYEVGKLENVLNTEREQHRLERSNAVAAYEMLEQDYRQKIANIKSYTDARYALLQERYEETCARNDEQVIALDGKTATSKIRKVINNAFGKVQAGVEKVGGDRSFSLNDTSIYIENLHNHFDSDKS